MDGDQESDGTYDDQTETVNGTASFSNNDSGESSGDSNSTQTSSGTTFFGSSNGRMLVVSGHRRDGERVDRLHRSLDYDDNYAYSSIGFSDDIPPIWESTEIVTTEYGSGTDFTTSIDYYTAGSAVTGGGGGGGGDGADFRGGGGFRSDLFHSGGSHTETVSGEATPSNDEPAQQRPPQLKQALPVPAVPGQGQFNGGSVSFPTFIVYDEMPDIFGLAPGVENRQNLSLKKLLDRLAADGQGVNTDFTKPIVLNRETVKAIRKLGYSDFTGVIRAGLDVKINAVFDPGVDPRGFLWSQLYGTKATASPGAFANQFLPTEPIQWDGAYNYPSDYLNRSHWMTDTPTLNRTYRIPPIEKADN